MHSAVRKRTLCLSFQVLPLTLPIGVNVNFVNVIQQTTISNLSVPRFETKEMSPIKSESREPPEATNHGLFITDPSEREIQFH